MVIRVMTFGDGYDGPTYLSFEVGCTQEQYNNGEHYAVAMVYDLPGYTAKLAADEHDSGTLSLFTLFDHDNARTLLLPGGEVRERLPFKNLTLREYADAYIRKVYAAMHYNKVTTAQALGISLKTLYNRLSAMGENHAD